MIRQVFKYNSKEEGNKVELYLRCTETGSVEWYEPYIVKIEPPKHRVIRAATVRFGNSILTRPLTLEGQRVRIAQKLDEVAALKPDIVVFPEFSPVIGVPRENYRTYFDNVAEGVPDGKLCRILSRAAAKHGMYVIAGIIEKRDKCMFNTAVIFDRKGNFIGQYDKTHLTFGEMKEGFSCGGDYPVFDLDFGRIGIHICYDEWFPEVSRYYAYKGAEILFLPVAGGKPITWRTRALYNASENCRFLIEHEPHAFTGSFIKNTVKWFSNIFK